MGAQRGIWVRLVACVVAAALLGACARLSDSHGYVPDDSLLAEVKVGLDTKETVERLLGRPGTLGLVDERGWYYVHSDYERFLWRAPKEVHREVVAVSFNAKGQVSNVERFGLEKGEVVVLSRRVTTGNTQGVGLLAQLLRNLGTFDAGSLLKQ